MYRIPGLLVTKSGIVIAHCEARRGTGDDWDPIDICMRQSTDGGRSWGERYVAVDHTRFDPDKPINNFSCFADLEIGDLHLLFCSNYERLYYVRSDETA